MENCLEAANRRENGWGKKKNASAVINGRYGKSGSRFNLLNQEISEVNAPTNIGNNLDYDGKHINGTSEDVVGRNNGDETITESVILEEMIEKIRGIKGIGGKRSDTIENFVLMHDIVTDVMQVKNTNGESSKVNSGRSKRIEVNGEKNKVYNLATRGKVSFKAKGNEGKNYGENNKADKLRHHSSNSAK